MVGFGSMRSKSEKSREREREQRKERHSIVLIIILFLFSSFSWYKSSSSFWPIYFYCLFCKHVECVYVAVERKKPASQSTKKKRREQNNSKCTRIEQNWEEHWNVQIITRKWKCRKVLQLLLHLKITFSFIFINSFAVPFRSLDIFVLFLQVKRTSSKRKKKYEKIRPVTG